MPLYSIMFLSAEYCFLSVTAGSPVALHTMPAPGRQNPPEPKHCTHDHGCTQGVPLFIDLLGVHYLETLIPVFFSIYSEAAASVPSVLIQKYHPKAIRPDNSPLATNTCRP